MAVRWVRLVLVMMMLLTMTASRVRSGVSAAPKINNSTIIQFGCVAGCVYTPSEVVIQPGDTVEWDGSLSSHPLVSDDGLWTTVNSGTQFTYTFAVTGTFLFHCAVHGGPGGVGMAGRVIVREFPFKAYLPLAFR